MIGSKKLRVIELSAYMIPSFLIIGFVFFFPIVMILKYSFFGIKNGFGNFTLNNYILIFQTDIFLKGIKNNFILLIAVPIILLLSILFAILLYERIGGWKFYRFIIFIPYIMPVPVVGIIFIYIFQLNGIFNFVLEKIGLSFLIQDWFGNPKLTIWTIMFIIIWKLVGFGTILLFARMMNINHYLYDAAEIDGCNWFGKHFHITIPQSRNTIGFLTTIMVITMLAWVFNYVFVTTHGGPNNSSMVTELTIYTMLFKFNNVPLASAAAFILFLITLIFIIIQIKFREREV